VIIYTLIIGRPPYETEDVKETYKRIQENKYSFPNHIYISEEGRDLIEKILVMNPADRLNLDGMRAHPFMNNVKIPKSMPQYTTNFPPNANFYRRLNVEKIKNISDLSTCNDSNDEHYKNLIKFSEMNLIDVNRKNLINDHVIFDKASKNLSLGDNKIIASKNNNKLSKNSILNISQTKESHKLVNSKMKKININEIFHINEIIDYTNDFGVIYKTNKNFIGIFFSDKTNIFKDCESFQFYYINKMIKSQKSPQLFNIEKPKDIPTEIKNKFEILKNYQSYLKLNSSNKNTVKFFLKIEC
jgi:polo-like kinase 1